MRVRLLALGLALAAFYVLPAAYEQRWVNIADAVSAGSRPLDNFLFVHTTDVDHDKLDGGGKVLVCSGGHTFAVMPIPACAVIRDSARTVESPPIDRLIGIEPDRLNRPPSTPGMG